MSALIPIMFLMAMSRHLSVMAKLSRYALTVEEPHLGRLATMPVSIGWLPVVSHKARPMHPDWARSLRDQCSAAGVLFLFKQHGEFLGGQVANEQIDASKSGGWVSLDGAYHDGNDRSAFREGDAHVYRCGTKTAGRLLDGQEWNQYPDPAQ